jgi:hypothetical protein
MEQLKVATNDLQSVANKKVAMAAVSMSSMEAFPTVGLTLQLEVPTAAASIPPEGGGGVLELWPRWLARGGGGGHIGGYPAVGDPPHSITGVRPI